MKELSLDLPFFTGCHKHTFQNFPKWTFPKLWTQQDIQLLIGTLKNIQSLLHLWGPALFNRELSHYLGSLGQMPLEVMGQIRITNVVGPLTNPIMFIWFRNMCWDQLKGRQGLDNWYKSQHLLRQWHQWVWKRSHQEQEILYKSKYLLVKKFINKNEHPGPLNEFCRLAHWHMIRYQKRVHWGFFTTVRTFANSFVAS